MVIYQKRKSKTDLHCELLVSLILEYRPQIQLREIKASKYVKITLLAEKKNVQKTLINKYI